MLEDGICLIEWPDIAAEVLPAQQTILLRLTHVATVALRRSKRRRKREAGSTVSSQFGNS